MDKRDLCYLSVRGALDLFSGRKLSPVELLKALLERIESVNPSINAVADCYFEEALVKAREAETRWLNGAGRPLEGIPVAVKDAQHVAGRRTTYGSPVYRDNIAQQSDPMIERLLAAGAIIHVRTTVSEFCISGVCHSTMWGTTFNPWNRRYSPGGSSGGSAAALAAGMTPLATGTDIGGSIRIPASACGVVGYKPPHGRNPHAPPFNVDRLEHCGPLARSIVDVALVQNVIAGHHPEDHDSLVDKLIYPDFAESIIGLRIAWSPDLSYRAVDSEVLTNTERALAVLRDLGCAVERIELGWTEEVDRTASDWYSQCFMGRMLRSAVKHHPDLVLPELRRLASSWNQSSSGAAHVLELIARMSSSFSQAMGNHDVFICPTMSVAAVKANQSMWDSEFRIDGRSVDPEFGYSMTHQFNLLGNCPAISIPSGRTRDGVPTGLQIVGKPFDDLAVIRTALAFEEATGPAYAHARSCPKLEDQTEEKQPS
jgi:amidase